MSLNDLIRDEVKSYLSIRVNDIRADTGIYYDRERLQVNGPGFNPSVSIPVTNLNCTNASGAGILADGVTNHFTKYIFNVGTQNYTLTITNGATDWGLPITIRPGHSFICKWDVDSARWDFISEPYYLVTQLNNSATGAVSSPLAFNCQFERFGRIVYLQINTSAGNGNGGAPQDLNLAGPAGAAFVPVGFRPIVETNTTIIAREMDARATKILNILQTGVTGIFQFAGTGVNGFFRTEASWMI
jgi:hypothetical protein